MMSVNLKVHLRDESIGYFWGRDNVVAMLRAK